MIKEIFGKVKIYRLHSRVDNRGSLEYVFDENTACFNARETRIYSMPKEGTFFGIHYREEFHCKMIRYSFILWTEVATMLIQNILITWIPKSVLNYPYPFPKSRIMI